MFTLEYSTPSSASPVRSGGRFGHRPYGPAAVNAAKTHCPRGHEYTAENTLAVKGGRWCRTCRNQQSRDRMRIVLNRRGPEYSRAKNLARYGLTIASYEALVKEQNGLCMICRKVPTMGRGKRLYVDHCHKTGRVRGLLCNRCNSAIGLFDEDPARMRWASNYILEAELVSEKLNG